MAAYEKSTNIFFLDAETIVEQNEFQSSAAESQLSYSTLTTPIKRKRPVNDSEAASKAKKVQKCNPLPPAGDCIDDKTFCLSYIDLNGCPVNVSVSRKLYNCLKRSFGNEDSLFNEMLTIALKAR